AVILAAALALAAGARAAQPPPAPAAPLAGGRGGEGAPTGPTAAAPFILVLDPGHGGRETGSRGAGPLLEKDFTLRIARLLAGRLERRPGIKVVLTRGGDIEVTAVQRAAVANYNGAALLVSLHADSSWTPGVRGPSILVSSPQRPPVAAGEPPEAVALRWQRGQNVNLAGSRRFAKGLRSRFAAIMKGSEAPLRALPLRALEGAKMPAIYVSLGVISTPEEAARLREMKGEDPYLIALEKEILRFGRIPDTPLPEPPAPESLAPEAPSAGAPEERSEAEAGSAPAGAATPAGGATQAEGAR
ncbi:MAG: N-acetylmuramoyl-L-alanine amidase, partial [bacterium]